MAYSANETITNTEGQQVETGMDLHEILVRYEDTPEDAETLYLVNALNIIIYKISINPNLILGERLAPEEFNNPQKLELEIASFAYTCANVYTD